MQQQQRLRVSCQVVCADESLGRDCGGGRGDHGLSGVADPGGGGAVGAAILHHFTGWPITLQTTGCPAVSVDSFHASNF